MTLLACARIWLSLCGFGVPGGADGWISFTEDTTARLQASAAVTTADLQEKDYAWADVDQDGDIDVVCVRKQPWNTPGRFRNVRAHRRFGRRRCGDCDAADSSHRTALFATPPGRHVEVPSPSRTRVDVIPVRESRR